VISTAKQDNLPYVAFLPQPHLEINLTSFETALDSLRAILVAPYNASTVDQVRTDHAQLYATTSPPVAAMSFDIIYALE
jgi:hypothetical protein